MSRRILSIFLGFLLSLPVPGFACHCLDAPALCDHCTSYQSLPPLPQGPLHLTSITPEQLTPEYWIQRIPTADQLIKTPEELKVFNQETRAMVSEVVDIFGMDRSRRGKPIADQIELEYETVKGRILFDANDRPIPKSIFEEQIKPVAQWWKVPERLQMRWGAAVRPTSIRALPTDIKMIEELGDIEFDQLQFTLIKLWTPVGIYHTSSDRQWYYIQAPYARGWVKAKDIALFPSREELRGVLKSEPYLVVTGESIPIYSGPDFQEILQEPSMGAILPLAEKTESAYVVWMPRRTEKGRATFGKGYLSLKEDVSRGFLPYTQANIIRQAFKLLGARYGWGGMYNGRDCSGFTQDVFLSFGIDMPRTSKGQIFVGTQLSHFRPMRQEDEKIYFLHNATPAITLLRMPLHMMIYLGEVNGQFYVIHSTWAERVSMDSDEKVRINQVVVSDLTLNGRSYLGSLFDRIICMNEVD